MMNEERIGQYNLVTTITAIPYFLHPLRFLMLENSAQVSLNLLELPFLFYCTIDLSSSVSCLKRSIPLPSLLGVCGRRTILLALKHPDQLYLTTSDNTPRLPLFIFLLFLPRNSNGRSSGSRSQPAHT